MKDWLTSGGLIVFQVAIFATLIGLIGVVWYLVKRQALARQQTLLELKQTAEALTARTEEIAAEVKRETVERSERIAKDIEQLGHLFDRVGVDQRAAKATIESVNEVVHRELEPTETDRTTRQQIDAIQTATETIAEKLTDAAEKLKD